VSKRKIKALGIDTPSIDYGQSKDFKTHQILLGENKPGFENVAHLDQLPSTGIYVMALPMKIGKGSGAPLRIVAGISK
jgi:kynurenine formamidase